MDKNMLRTSYYSKERYLMAFLMGFFVIIFAMLPFMALEDGYFIYYGDYNAQQIPFYNLANDAVRNGQFGWNWFTDLGSDLTTSYSFYLISSPFFWLSTILPRSLVSYSLPVLLALKHGFASLTAYIFIRRFVRSKEAALTGALLYSFSGFQIFNIFFNHFQDVTAFFPLMLIAMEENICNRRRGWFAIIVAFMAALNYYFFTGQVVFLILYFLLRIPCKDFPVTFRKFLGLFVEAVLGTALAAFILLPSALAIMGNFRVSEHLYGESNIIYYEGSRIFRVIQSFFLIPDVPARPNLFKSEGAKWSSVGGYLPLFSMLGVITFMRTRKKHWAVRLSWICIFCSFIPILNSMFYTFNASYYARWFYMPILIFAMMTAQTLDEEDVDFKPAIFITIGVMLFFGLISFIPEKKDDKLSWFTLPADFGYFWLTFGVAVVMLLMAIYIIIQKNQNKYYGGLMVYATALASLGCILTTVMYGAVSPTDAKAYISYTIESKDDIYEEVSEDNFFRVDISDGCDNYPMIWGLPNMRAFQSVVSTSIMDFYDSIGVQRDVASRADITHYTLRGLFSVKYFYREKDGILSYKALEKGITLEDMPFEEAVEISGSNGIISTHVDIREYLPEFEYIGENENFEIYENKLYIPMGFSYDTYVSESDAEKKSKIIREKLLIDSLVLNDEQIEKYSDILEEASPSVYNLTKNDYIDICREKQENCADSFKWDSYGFEAEISLDKPELVFFSVPYSKGWSAEVNGKPVDVERVSYGFMAVKAEQGENVITFSYRTPGLFEGSIISIGSAVLLLAFVLICRKGDKKLKFRRISHSYDYNSCQKLTAEETYTRNCTKNTFVTEDK
ncbi:MAG: YfhO family protein [Ruminococcus sp.]|nr:YfhO family protein [Ruminococcus sp.]